MCVWMWNPRVSQEILRFDLGAIECVRDLSTVFGKSKRCWCRSIIALKSASPLLQGSAMDEDDSQDELINRNTSHSKGKRASAWAISGKVFINHIILIFFCKITHQNVEAYTKALHLTSLIINFVIFFRWLRWWSTGVWRRIQQRRGWWRGRGRGRGRSQWR